MVKTNSKKIWFGSWQYHIISAEKGWGIDDLLSSIANIRENEDVYIVGTTNVWEIYID